MQVIQAQSTDANLSGLTIGSGTLMPSFDSNRQSYTIIKGNLIADKSISVTPIASDLNATIEISLNGGSIYNPIASGATSNITLASVVTSVVLRVTAQDLVTQKNYTIRATFGINGVDRYGRIVVAPSLDRFGREPGNNTITPLTQFGSTFTQRNWHNTICDGSAPTEVVEITSPATGKVWMDRNLGAARAALSTYDYFAYGCLYQWGRGNDGHASMIWKGLSSTGSTETLYFGTTTTQAVADTPGHNLFISNAVDWRSASNDNLWQGIDGINNPCPAGYRVPTHAEFQAESANSNVFTSLKMIGTNGRYGEGTHFANDFPFNGFCWTSTVNGSQEALVSFLRGNFTKKNDVTISSTLHFYKRSYAYSVRCIKD